MNAGIFLLSLLIFVAMFFFEFYMPLFFVVLIVMSILAVVIVSYNVSRLLSLTAKMYPASWIGYFIASVAGILLSIVLIFSVRILLNAGMLLLSSSQFAE